MSESEAYSAALLAPPFQLSDRSSCGAHAGRDSDIMPAAVASARQEPAAAPFAAAAERRGPTPRSLWGWPEATPGPLPWEPRSIVLSPADPFRGDWAFW